MKKLFVLATAAMVMTTVAFAHGSDDKKKCAKGKECCKKDSKDAKACKKDAKKDAKTATVKATPAPAAK